MILHAEMAGGVSGDMIAGAMLDCGMPFQHLEAEIGKLTLPKYKMSASKVIRSGISCTKFNVEVPVEDEERTFAQIRDLIESSQLSESVKERAITIFRRLAQAEGAVHNRPLKEVHFHEVGAIDSIINIVAAAVGMEYFKAEGFYHTDFLFGEGTVNSAHGILPVPAPATAKLTKGFPFRRVNVPGELTTPTGAAVITAYSLGRIPDISFCSTAIGCGAGSREFEQLPSYFRLWVIQDVESASNEKREIIIEANIDDMEPEFYPYLMEKLYSAGAKDVFLTPVTMKKGRPGVLITITTDESQLHNLGSLLFRESITIVIRWRYINRWKLERQACEVQTKWGALKAKKIEFEGEVRVLPEYEECCRVALKEGIPLSEVYQAVIIAGKQV